MTPGQQVARRKSAGCFHFRGIQHATCNAGVTMAAMFDLHAEKGAAKYPCLTDGRDTPCAIVCESFRAFTQEEMDAVEAEFTKRWDEMAAKAARGECRDCGVKATAVRQVGRCVYAEPCGHRIGQGDARQVAKSMKVSVIK